MPLPLSHSPGRHRETRTQLCGGAYAQRGLAGKLLLLLFGGYKAYYFVLMAGEASNVEYGRNRRTLGTRKFNGFSSHIILFFFLFTDSQDLVECCGFTLLGKVGQSAVTELAGCLR